MTFSPFQRKLSIHNSTHNFLLFIAVSYGIPMHSAMIQFLNFCWNSPKRCQTFTFYKVDNSVFYTNLPLKMVLFTYTTAKVKFQVIYTTKPLQILGFIIINLKSVQYIFLVLKVLFWCYLHAATLESSFFNLTTTPLEVLSCCYQFHYDTEYFVSMT